MRTSGQNKSNREIKKFLRKKGYLLERQRGTHQIYRKGNHTIGITNPKINQMMEKRLMKEINQREKENAEREEKELHNIQSTEKNWNREDSKDAG